MQLPKDDASFVRRVHFGRYVTRRLRAGGFTDPAESVRAATRVIKDYGRAWEDSEEDIQDALADRDIADQTLDTVAQETRLELASRSLTASREAPYTLIFPEGSPYYTAATVDQQTSRYNELTARIAESLPESDPLRNSMLPRLKAGIEAWTTATTALDAARTSLSLARTRLDAAEDDWSILLEKVYGTLVEAVGREKAEHYFPRARRSASIAASDTP